MYAIRSYYAIIYASSKVLAFHKKHLKLEELQYQSIKSADEATTPKIYVVNLIVERGVICSILSNGITGKTWRNNFV